MLVRSLLSRGAARVAGASTAGLRRAPSAARNGKKAESARNMQELCGLRSRLFASEACAERVEDRSQFVTSMDEATIRPSEHKVLPTYRVMDETGVILNQNDVPNLSDETLLRMYRSMVALNQMDQLLYDIQRQGRISFYMTAFGEEATHFGSASALTMEDVIFGQYREAGVLMWRGFTIDDFTNQCYSNALDAGKGRQMPVHYGSAKLNFQTISSPLATQIPQAAGTAYALKLMGKDAICMVYFGEGAASEGDFHAALNFAATLKCPTVFFCRNNKYAISTPSYEQYRGDGIAIRGLAYGIHTIRVDGNDILAVHNATKAAREYALKNSAPVLIEAMTYRVGHHSTSDDASRYRTNAEVEKWTNGNNPIKRLRGYITSKGLWDEDKEKQLWAECKANVLTSIKKAESELKPPIADLFNDVYDKDTWNIAEQRKELAEHLEKYADKYPMKIYKH